MNVLNLPTAEQQDVQNALLASIASKLSPEGMTISNWGDVQRLVRMGLHKDMFAVGDQFVTTYNGQSQVVDIIGINHDIPSDERFTNSLTLQFHDCLLDAQFSAPQALAYTEVELPAGDQILTFDGVKYSFTNTIAIPANSQIVISGRDEYIPLKVSIYADEDRQTAIESDLVVTVVEGGANTITDINDKIRTRYGSNNYVESAIRQWLNSDEDMFKWNGRTKFDRPSSYTANGFMKLLDSDLVKVIGKVDKQVARNTITDGGGQDLFSDKVFLLSRVEVYGGTEGVADGETPYPYYSSMHTSPTSEARDWRIKLLSLSPRHWWLRSPRVGLSNYTRYVYPTGTVNGHSAYGSLGVSPACVII